MITALLTSWITDEPSNTWLPNNLMKTVNETFVKCQIAFKWGAVSTIVNIIVFVLTTTPTICSRLCSFEAIQPFHVTGTCRRGNALVSFSESASVPLTNEVRRNRGRRQALFFLASQQSRLTEGDERGTLMGGTSLCCVSSVNSHWL